MDFDELHSFIEQALEGEYDTADMPRSETELMLLVDTLKGKAKPASPKPELHIGNPMPPEVPEYEASDEVIELNREKGRIQQKLEEKDKTELPQTQAERREGRRARKSLREDLQRLDREIYKLKSVDDARHRERLAGYEEAFRVYQDQLSEQTDRARTVEETNKARVQTSQGSAITKQRMRIVSEVRAKVRKAFEPGAHVPRGRFSWLAVPQGPLSRPMVTGHYKGLYHRGLIEKYDEERLDKAYSLNPERAHLGTGESEGYVIFTFSHTTKFMMERPEVGNAIFIVDSSHWEDWSQMNKQQLMEHPLVTRIPHQGGWFDKVQHVLEINSTEREEDS